MFMFCWQLNSFIRKCLCLFVSQLLLFPLVFSKSETLKSEQNSSSNGLQAAECTGANGQLRVVVLFDITQEDNELFERQQSRLKKALRHIDLVSKDRSRLYGLVAFHRLAVVLSALNAPQADSVDRIISQIDTLKPRRRAEPSSPAKALDVAAELFDSIGKKGPSLVLLVHEGQNTDLIAETLEASDRLASAGVSLFAIAGGHSPNVQTLLGYTKEAAKILSASEHQDRFFAALDRDIGRCAVEKPASRQSGGTEGRTGHLELSCGRTNEVDLLLALDTSGSVFHSFGQQRQLALDFLSALQQPDTAEKSSLQVGLISFAAEPSLVLSLAERAIRAEVLARLEAIQFTGRNTRIANAAELALEELAKHGRAEALKVLVLVSDGHGEEFWAQAQAVGRRLQQSPQLQLFAVSASADFNRAELALYTGHAERVFVGQRHQSFLPTISAFLNKCLASASNGTSAAGNGSAEAEEMGKRDTQELIHQMLDTAKTANNASQEERQRDQPVTESEEEGGAEEEETTPSTTDAASQGERRALETRLTEDCPTDLLFLLDRFSPASALFERQLGLAVQLVERLQASDVDQARLRLAAVSFGREPRLEASWAEQVGKAEFQRRLRAIQPARAQSSFAAAVNLTMQQIKLHRRPSARLLLFVLWSGSNGRNTAEELTRAVRPFSALPRAELFAVTVNPSAQLDRLRLLAGDQWHVFIDARAKQFVDQVSQTLLDCVLPPGRDLLRQGEEDNHWEDLQDSHEPRDSVERVEHLQLAARALQRQHSQNCPEDPIQLVLVLHSGGERNSVEQFDAQKRAAMDVLRQAPAEQFPGRIRLSLWDGTRPVLKAAEASLDNALFAVDRMDWQAEEHQQQSLAETLALALAEARKSKREGARTALVLLTDGGQVPAGNGGKDVTELPSLGGRASSSSAFVLNFGPEAANKELQQLLEGNGTTSESDSRTEATTTTAFVRVFNAQGHGQMARFVDEFRRRVIWCRPKLAHLLSDSALPSEQMSTHSKSKGLFVAERLEKEPAKSKGQQQQELIKLPSTLPPPASPNVSALVSSEQCKVDLVLIIDTSQSVAEEFQQQLQFALELVKRLPDADFGQRVQVGVVSFHRHGSVQFALGELREKQAVLDALSAIQHTGGSTSVVEGINLAIEEVSKRRRKDARLMMVLVSDGNSQDPWPEVVATADKLRAIQADVYAVTVSHDYFFRELELYTGNKWFVYIDARIRQFLDEAEMSLVECRSPSVPLGSNQTMLPLRTLLESSTAGLPALSTTTTSDGAGRANVTEGQGDCRNEPVDLIFILDTSTSVERDFYAQKIFALDLVRVLPEPDFARRLSISLVKFHSEASLQFPFRAGRRRDDVLYEIERIEHTGGQTSLVAGAEAALAEIGKNHRSDARLVAVIISDGNSQDEWARVQETARRLRNATRGEVFAVSLSAKFALDELLEYTQSQGRIFTDRAIEQFLQEVGRSVLGCSETGGPMLVTLVPEVEAQPTPAPRNGNETDQEKKKPQDDAVGLARRNKARGGDFARDAGPVQLAAESLLIDGIGAADEEEDKSSQQKCRFSKLDLIIILDASTSRESVFEHQRELALSLIERLPISRQGTHVATGINSFTNLPVLRQTLGLGRDRKMVRKAIEDIKYRGGSTLTSKAVELAVQDLEKGRRQDALQVVVLMNDGMSQDPWERVLVASQKLAQSGAQRFGVALGDDVDLRELRHYVGDEQRIYRDGETERFLRDIVALLGGGKECGQLQSRKLTEELKLADEGDHGFDFQMDESASCQRPKLDLVVLLDNASPEGNDPKLNSNRYLLLDVLGSLPLGHRVQIAVLSMAGPQLEYLFSDAQDRESVFRHIEQIRPVPGTRPSYAKAVQSALDYLGANRRADARAILLLVGDGRNTGDSAQERAKAGSQLKKAQGNLTCLAVDSGKQVDEQTLATFTGSPDHIYAYDRNAEFAHFLLAQATASEKCGGQADSELTTNGSQKLLAVGRQTRQRDIAKAGTEETGDKLFGRDEKVLAKVGEKLAATGTTEPNVQLTAKKLTSKRPSNTISNARANNKEREQPAGIEQSTRVSRPVTQKPESSSIQRSRGPSRTVSSSTSASPISATAASSTHQRSSSSILLSTTSSSSPPVPFRPGCLLDVLLVVDCSGSVEPAFERQKQLAAQIVQKLRLGPDNARVALIKFAAAGKVRTVHPFAAEQSQQRLLHELDRLEFSDGVTAIHSALQQAIVEYSPLRGARPGLAQPLALVFTDGFGSQDFAEEAKLLHRLVPNVFAIAATDGEESLLAVARQELAQISGDPKRVIFADESGSELHRQLREYLRGC